MGLLEMDKYGAKLETIRRDFVQQGVEMCCLQVFLCWVKGEDTQQPASWETVLTCLHDMDMNAVVKDIKKALQEEEEEEGAQTGKMIAPQKCIRNFAPPPPPSPRPGLMSCLD